jgi:hypothetical protein
MKARGLEGNLTRVWRRLVRPRSAWEVAACLSIRCEVPYLCTIVVQTGGKFCREVTTQFSHIGCLLQLQGRSVLLRDRTMQEVRLYSAIFPSNSMPSRRDRAAGGYCKAMLLEIE